MDAQLIDKMIIDIKNVRKTIKKYEGIGIPQMERCIRTADMNLHWILWLSGEAVEYRPDLPIEIST